MRRGRRQGLKGGDEWDAVTGWRRMLKSFSRPGKAKAIKRKMNKRERKETRAELRSETEGAC